MEQNNFFSFSRLVNMIIRHYVLSYKGLIIAFSAIVGVLAIIGALISFGQPGFNFEIFTGLFYFLMFTVGYIFTSTVFNEMHRPECSVYYLSLPSSNFEKLLTAWLASTLFYLLISFAAYHIAYVLASLFALAMFEVPFGLRSVLSAEFFKVSLVYSITQSIFFFGAVYFKGYNFLKTILSVFVLFLFWSVYQSLVGSVAFREIFLVALQYGNNVDDHIKAPGLEEYVEAVFIPVLKIGFYLVMPIFFLGLSYLRINEREV